MMISGNRLGASKGRVFLEAADGQRQLNDDEREQLLPVLIEELNRQRAENDKLKAVAERANQGLTVWKLVTTVTGALVAAAIAVLWLGGQYSAWTAIKQAHKIDIGNGQVGYAHQTFLPKDVEAIRSALGMAEQNEQVLRSEIDSVVNGLGYVKSGEELRIRDALEPSIALTRWGNKVVEALRDTRADLPDNWSRTWIVEKVKE